MESQRKQPERNQLSCIWSVIKFFGLLRARSTRKMLSHRRLGSKLSFGGDNTKNKDFLPRPDKSHLPSNASAKVKNHQGRASGEDHELTKMSHGTESDNTKIEEVGVYDQSLFQFLEKHIMEKSPDLQKSFKEAVDDFLSQNISRKDASQDGQFHPSKELIDVLRVMSIDDEFLSRLSQCPIPMLLTYVQEFRSIHTKNDCNLEKTDTTQMNLGSDVCSRNSNTAYWKHKFQEKMPSKRERTFVILAERNCGLKNPKTESVASSLSETKFMIGSNKGGRSFGPHISFSQIKRKLKCVLGMNPQKISHEDTSRVLFRSHELQVREGLQLMTEVTEPEVDDAMKKMTAIGINSKKLPTDGIVDDTRGELVGKQVDETPQAKHVFEEHLNSPCNGYGSENAVSEARSKFNETFGSSSSSGSGTLEQIPCPFGQPIEPEVTNLLDTHITELASGTTDKLVELSYNPQSITSHMTVEPKFSQNDLYSRKEKLANPEKPNICQSPLLQPPGDKDDDSETTHDSEEISTSFQTFHENEPILGDKGVMCSPGNEVTREVAVGVEIAQVGEENLLLHETISSSDLSDGHHDDSTKAEAEGKPSHEPCIELLCPSNISDQSSPVSVLEQLSEDKATSPHGKPCNIFSSSNQVRELPPKIEVHPFNVLTDEDEAVLEFIKLALQAARFNKVRDELNSPSLSADRFADSFIFSNLKLFPGLPCHSKKLLFDCIDEILVELSAYGQSLSSQLHVLLGSLLLHKEETVYPVVQQVHNRLASLALSRSLDDIIKYDMEKPGSWIQIQEMEIMVTEITGGIFEDLLNETI